MVLQEGPGVHSPGPLVTQRSHTGQEVLPVLWPAEDLGALNPRPMTWWRMPGPSSLACGCMGTVDPFWYASGKVAFEPTSPFTGRSPGSPGHGNHPLGLRPRSSLPVPLSPRGDSALEHRRPPARAVVVARGLGPAGQSQPAGAAGKLPAPGPLPQNPGGDLQGQTACVNPFATLSTASLVGDV